MVGCVLGSLYKLLNQVRHRGISVPNIDILKIKGYYSLILVWFQIWFLIILFFCSYMVGCVLGSLYKLLNQVRDKGISVPNIDILKIQGYYSLILVLFQIWFLIILFFCSYMVGCVLGSLYKLLNQVRDRGISVPNIDILKMQGYYNLISNLISN